jgi:hypothetical protein
MALFSCHVGRRVEGVHDYVRGDWAPGRARSCMLQTGVCDKLHDVLISSRPAPSLCIL